MTRILHVLDASLSAAALDRVRAMADRLPPQRFSQQVICLDPQTTRRVRADFAALPNTARVAVTCGCFFSDTTLRQSSRDVADVVYHACGLSALTACRMYTHGPIVFAADTAPVTRRQQRWLRAVFADEHLCVTASQSSRRGLINAGLRPDRIVVVRGPIDFAAINAARREDVRHRLLAADEGPLILSADPGTREGGAFEVAWAVAILQQIHPRIRMLVPFASPHADRARRLLDAAHLPSVWITPPGDWRWPQCVAASDVFVDASPRTASTEPVAWAMAAGVPVIGKAIRSITELIADRHNGLLLRDPTARNLAAAMLTALEDSTLRRNITETARGQAYEVFSARAFLDNMAALFDNALARRDATQGVTDTAMVG